MNTARDSLQVSTTRVSEILAGKAAESIGKYLMENAQLTGVVEALQNRIAAQQEQISLLEGQLRKATPSPASAPPQDTPPS